MTAETSPQNGFIWMVLCRSRWQEEQVPAPGTSKDTAPMAQVVSDTAESQSQPEGPKLAEVCTEMCQDTMRWMCQVPGCTEVH